MDEWEQPEVINLAGKRIAIGPLREDLAPVYSKWMNDFWMQRTWGFPMRPQTVEETLEQTQRWARSEDSVHFTMYRHDTWQPIGLTDLQGIQMDHRVAELGIGIGEPQLRGQGYGSETVHLMLFYAFRLLGLHAVHLTYDGANPGAPRAYAKAGFKPAGTYREYVAIDGRRYDMLHMDCLASEFIDPEVVYWGAPGGGEGRH